MNRAFVVAAREVKTYLQDRADLAFSLLLPIAIFALMYGAFGNDIQFQGTAYVVNGDEQPLVSTYYPFYSAQLLKDMEQVDSLEIEFLSADEANSKLKNSDVLMVLYIPIHG